MLQDFVSTPPLRSVVTSKDNKAWVLPVGVAGELGTPRSYAAFNQISDIVKPRRRRNAPDGKHHRPRGDRRRPHGRGRAGSASDRAGDRRAGAHRSVGGLPQRGHHAAAVDLDRVVPGDRAGGGGRATPQLTGSGVSNQSIVFLSAIMAGAGTDYAVFLISRYHDYLRSGADFDQAVKRALISIGKVITASATTVGITFLLISFARMGSVQDGRDVSAIGIGVAFLAAVTLLPAILVARRATRLGQATARTDRPVLATFRHPHRAPAEGTSGCQSAGADHPGQLCRLGALQLRRSQGPAVFRSELRRICRAGSPFPGESVHSGVHPHPVAA